MTHYNPAPSASRRQELREKIEEMEITLRKLREQLRAEEEADQHDMIDHLEVYLGEIDSKYTNLREFWSVIREEFRELVAKGSRDKQEK